MTEDTVSRETEPAGPAPRQPQSLAEIEAENYRRAHGSPSPIVEPESE